MRDQIKKFLNEEQDPKAIEKITDKVGDLLMKGEEIGYIGVQKKPAITVFPDSIVLTNKRIILCKPKNLGLSMDFVDYVWEDVAGTFVKENILGSEFSFATKTDMQVSIDYIPKIQARKIYTFAKEQLELLKTGMVENSPIFETTQAMHAFEMSEEIEEIETEEVTNFAEIIPVSGYRDEKQHPDPSPEMEFVHEKPVAELSQEELFEKLQNYKKLLDNGLILQGEYDALKKEILSKM
ncbi:PH domain-containing protein [Flavobacterium caeni]|uniref:PH domain-containing protein n=1 Tax=Flavobacterium caeni TaxID=490189 RepID=A0A1G5GGP6_9FLAO|nr:PH domain-containing protein [Flavobacterium caeni]SCY49888.1 PH domain-containing protein [Flavobacterium caeni]